MANKIRCKHCGDIVTSSSRHDWQCCSCFKNEEGNTGVYIDGGDEYFRVGGNLDNIEYLSIHGDQISKAIKEDLNE